MLERFRRKINFEFSEVFTAIKVIFRNPECDENELNEVAKTADEIYASIGLCLCIVEDNKVNVLIDFCNCMR